MNRRSTSIIRCWSTRPGCHPSIWTRRRPIGGTLLGIKGQYLMFDSGVINMRKYGGYQLSLYTIG